MTLDAFRAEAAGWIGRPVDAFDCTAWVHEPGQRPRKCLLLEADALSIHRAEHQPGGDASDPPALVGDTPSGEPCSLHEVKVVYLLAQKLLGFRGAVLPSVSGASWNLYRDE